MMHGQKNIKLVVKFVRRDLVYPVTVGIDQHMLTVNTDERTCSHKWI
jgi:hypothetical protein